jgi:hypothetical protein
LTPGLGRTYDFLMNGGGEFNGESGLDPCRFILVGEETVDNFRLSQLLRQIYGKEHVARFLELKHLEPHLADHHDHPTIVCLDLFSFDLTEAIEVVGRVRDSFPKVVFNLYLDQDEFRRRSHEIPEPWQARFGHYYKTFKVSSDIEFEPIVRGSLRPSQDEAWYNMYHEPIRLTPAFKRGLVQPAAEASGVSDKPMAFISYSRKDWPGFVSRLVADLTREFHKVWIDQDFIEGGVDWMDAIGQALQVCDTLLLVLSPDALSSKYVKSEYHYFYSQGKPIVPILYRKVDQLPFVLATLHYIDFTHGDPAAPYAELSRILSRPRNPQK